MDSSGGDIDAALDLAAEIQRYKVKVIAEGLCTSACASYLLAASPTREIRGTTLLGFHHTATAFVLAANTIFRDKPEVLARYRRRAAEEHQLYVAAGIDPALLIDPIYDLHPLCIIEAKVAGETVGILAIPRPSGWIPDTQVLASFHYVVGGDPPASVLGFLAENGRYMPKVTPGDLLQLDGKTYVAPSYAQVSAALQSLPRCPPDVLTTGSAKEQINEVEELESSH